MIQEQNHVIHNLNDKILQGKSETESFIEEEPKDLIDLEDNAVIKSNKFNDLYQKAAMKNEVFDESENEYEDVVEDDDNDSFITIDSDADSDCTVSNSHSSDSGYNDVNDSITATNSFGVNPLFSQSDGTEVCQDFVFYNQKEGKNRF